MLTRPIYFVLGWLITAFGGFMAIPTFVTWAYHDPDLEAFALTSILCMFIGVLMILMNKSSRFELSHKDGVFLTCVSWVILSVIGAIPLYFTGVSGSWVNAFFESTSALTTTGATVFTGLDDMPHGVLLWRSLMQWLGGMGIIVLAVAVLPFLGVGGMQMYKSEMPGVTKDKLQPKLHETARLLWFVYLTLTVLCAGAYVWAGMSFFDAICHSFTTVATAGFSNHDASIAYFNSLHIEAVAIFFMILGGLNFTFHFRALTGKGISMYWKDTEARVFFFILTAAIILITTNLMQGGETTPLGALRHGVFNAVAILTTTGYSTADFAHWPETATIIVLILMFIGGCSGSTAGGMKVLRLLLVMKQGVREIYRLLHPHGVMHVKLGRYTIPSHVIQAVWAFLGLYFITFVIIAIIMTLFGLDLISAFAAAAATVTNVGPGIGSVGPLDGYGHLADGAKLTLCFAMLLGRLELFTVLILFVPAFWKK